MPATRRAAVTAGVLYLLTHVTSITAVLLYRDIGEPERFLAGTGADGPVLLGSLLEVVLALAVIGTAVTLYPVVRRQHEGAALGYAALRTLEAAVITIGVVPLLALVTVRQSLAGAPGPETVALAEGLVALHDWTFLVGPGFVCGTNTVVLAALLLRSGLVPRPIAVLGLVGGPLVLATNAGVMFGLYDQVSVLTGLGAVPIFAWEICLAVYLITRGFRPFPATPDERAVTSGREPQPAGV
ncbi:DUF4386 domain-containing protein [Cellulomonas sp. NPDC055163]